MLAPPTQRRRDGNPRDVHRAPSARLRIGASPREERARARARDEPELDVRVRLGLEPARAPEPRRDPADAPANERRETRSLVGTIGGSAGTRVRTMRRLIEVKRLERVDGRVGAPRDRVGDDVRREVVPSLALAARGDVGVGERSRERRRGHRRGGIANGLQRGRGGEGGGGGGGAAASGAAADAPPRPERRAEARTSRPGAPRSSASDRRRSRGARRGRAREARGAVRAGGGPKPGVVAFGPGGTLRGLHGVAANAHAASSGSFATRSERVGDSRRVRGERRAARRRGAEVDDGSRAYRRVLVFSSPSPPPSRRLRLRAPGPQALDRARVLDRGRERAGGLRPPRFGRRRARRTPRRRGTSPWRGAEAPSPRRRSRGPRRTGAP